MVEPQSPQPAFRSGIFPSCQRLLNEITIVSQQREVEALPELPTLYRGKRSKECDGQGRRARCELCPFRLESQLQDKKLGLVTTVTIL